MRRVLAVMPAIFPSSVINVITPLQALAATGAITFTLRLEHETRPIDVAEADVIVLCRNTEPIYRPILDLALELGIPFINDLDDNLLAAPQGSDADQYHRHPARKAHYEWILQHASLIRVHSPTLLDALRPANPNIVLRWAAIDWSLAPSELPLLPDAPIDIVYAAQRESGRTLYARMQTDLERLIERHGDRVRLHFLGFNPPGLCGQPSVVCQPFEGDYARYFQRFTRAGYAIGLAPMLDDAFHNAKTNIKFRDYAAAGAAGIYSDVPLYNRNGVIDGETGLLVSGQPGTWLAAIERLMNNRDLLEAIRRKARAAVEERYRLDRVLDGWLEDFNRQPLPKPVPAEKLAEVSARQWWFVGIKQPDHPLIADLRGLLRRFLPVSLKMRYYDLRYMLLKRRFKRRT